MAHLIDKDVLVAQASIEITSCRLAAQEGILTEFGKGKLEGLEGIVDFLNILEVKEMDLDEVKIGETQLYIEDDGGEPPYNGKQWLDLGCLEYEIPKGKFKDGDNVEVVLRKIRKGE